MNYKKLFFLINVLSVYLFANPTGHSPIKGDITLENLDAKTLYVHASDHAIIEWDDFSIAADEMTRFIQPNANAAVLNRVVGNHLSKLLGTLQSNGQVYLVNPHGLVFGKDAVIDTNSFIASTLDVLNEDFLNGSEIVFRGDSQEALINLGTIRAENGDLILIANRLENQGELNAPNGIAALGCAREVLIKPQEQDRIYIRTSISEKDPLDTGIFNTGNITASNVTLIADGNHYAFAINHEGCIDAFGMQKVDGRIRLVAEEGINVINGSINAQTSENIGGTIHLLGDEVALLDNAEIHATGMSGGGCVLVGGDYQGTNTDIPNAKKTFMSEDALILANAQHEGPGGKVILWSDEITGVYGNLQAKGGQASGDGGLIEVSGKYLDFNGLADTRAEKGNAGTLLLDPSDITVTGAATSANVLFGGICGITTYCVTAALPTPANILNTAIIANLLLGNVTITTSSAFGDAGDLSILGVDIDGFASAFNLALIADRDIRLLNAEVENGGTGTLTATAGRDVILGPSSSSTFVSRGLTTVNAGRDVLLNGSGGFTTTSIGFGVGGFVTSSAVVNAGRDVIMDSNTLGGSTVIGSFTFPGPTSVTINAGRNFSMAGRQGPFGLGSSQVVSTDGVIQVTAGGDITITGGSVGAANIQGGIEQTIVAGGSFTLSAPPAALIRAELFQFTAGGPGISVTAGTDIILSGGVRIESFLGDPIVLVADNNFPTSPLIGPGSFQIIGPFARILSGTAMADGQIQIFTAVRSQNMIDPLAMINNTTFTPGTLYVDSASEQWLTYFPDPFGGFPFTIFYKDPIFAQALSQAVSSNVEILRFLNPYNEFTDWGLRYVNYYDEMGVPNTDHFIRRRHFKDLNVVLPVYNPDL